MKARIDAAVDFVWCRFGWFVWCGFLATIARTAGFKACLVMAGLGVTAFIQGRVSEMMKQSREHGARAMRVCQRALSTPPEERDLEWLLWQKGTLDFAVAVTAAIGQGDADTPKRLLGLIRVADQPERWREWKAPE